MRCFIALSLSPTARAWAVAIQAKLRTLDVHARWPHADDLHLTLRFLGEVQGARVPDIAAALETLGSEAGGDVRLSGLGGFPTAKRPRVVFAEVASGADVPARLVDALAPPLAALGFVPPDRPYHPHVTLCRPRGTTDSKRLAHALRDWPDDNEGVDVRVDEVVLFGNAPETEGRRYRALHRVALGA